MKKLYKRSKKIIGVLLLIFAISFFVFWEFIGRNELLYENVVVLKEDVYKGTIIEENMLEIIKLNKSEHIVNLIYEKSDIIGLEAKHYVPARLQLVPQFFDLPEFVLEDGEKIMRFPDEWLHSYPETLRRKDRIYLYAIKDKSSQDESSTELTSDGGAVAVAGKNTKNDNEEKGLYIFSTIVAYVKDNTNVEVESLDIDRLVGSSSVSTIEIIIKDQEFEMLRKMAEKGYKFALLYK